MTSDGWRLKITKLLEADRLKLRELDYEIERLRRLRAEIAGKISAREIDLAEAAAHSSGDKANAESQQKATRTELRGPTLRALTEAGETGIIQEELRLRLGAEKPSYNTCIWRLRNEVPPLITRSEGCLRITAEGRAEASTISPIS